MSCLQGHSTQLEKLPYTLFEEAIKSIQTSDTAWVPHSFAITVKYSIHGFA